MYPCNCESASATAWKPSTAAQGEPATFVDRLRRMRQHIRKALVHLEVVKRYQEGNFSEVAKKFYIADARKNAMSELKEALRLGDILAGEAPGNRKVTRDRILTRFHMATVSTQLGDSDATAQHLNAAQTMLDELSKQARFRWFSMWIGWGFQIWMPPLPTGPGTPVMPPLPTTHTRRR